MPAAENEIVLNPGMNQLFPVFFKLDHLHVLIVGGGNIGLEKITAVLKNSPQARITLVAKKIAPAIRGLKNQSSQLVLIERAFEVDDLQDKDLVIAATGDRSISELIQAESRKRKILINVADTPDLCDFYLGSIVQKGDLKIAISTNGKSPTLAKRLKEVFNEALPADTQVSIEQLNQFRNHLTGDFAEKVKQLNNLTALLIEKKEGHKGPYQKLIIRVIVYAAIAVGLIVLGHFL
jgi:siroheme synthase-like protein